MVVSSVKRVKYRVVWALKVVRVLRWWWWCGAGGIQAIAAAHWPLTSPPAGESSAAPPGQRAPNISTAADSPPFDFISTKYEHRFIIDWPGTTRKLQISPRFYPYQTSEELLVILDCWMLIFFVQMCHAVHQCEFLKCAIKVWWSLHWCFLHGLHHCELVLYFLHAVCLHQCNAVVIGRYIVCCVDVLCAHIVHMCVCAYMCMVAQCTCECVHVCVLE